MYEATDRPHQCEAALPGQTAMHHGGANALAIMRRIEDALDAETASLRGDPDFDLRASNARKSRHLYELSRALKNADEAGLAAAHRDSLQRLRDKLSANEATIRAHMGAVSEIADLLQETIERAQADGTYSQREFAQALPA